MSSKSILKRADYEKYLVRVYFGVSSDSECLEACIKRAYRDFNRSLRGLHTVDPARETHGRALDVIKRALEELKPKCTGAMRIQQFDEWHSGYLFYTDLDLQRKPRRSIHIHCRSGPEVDQHVSQVHLCTGEDRVDGFGEAYQFCHAPLDNILLGKLAEYGSPSLPRPWSRLDDYDEYFSFQTWIRNKFALAPLDTEFRLWLGQEAPLRPESQPPR